MHTLCLLGKKVAPHFFKKEAGTDMFSSTDIKNFIFKVQARIYCIEGCSGDVIDAQGVICDHFQRKLICTVLRYCYCKSIHANRKSCAL